MRLSMSACVLAACTAATTLLPSAARAETFDAHYISPVAVCSGPLPTYDAQLKRRPLGILNEGTTTVFISCSVPSSFAGDVSSPSNFVYVGFRSFGTGNGNVTCTLNAGDRQNGSGSVAQSAPITAGGDAYVYFSSVNKTQMWGAYNFSCTVPAGVEINTLEYGDGDADNGL
ncbi:MAG: hypothetical protein ACJ8GK_07650 [Luteimonas sp.]